MNAVTKQSVLDMLEAAKTHIEAGEHSEALEKIDAAICNVNSESDEESEKTDGEEENPTDEGVNDTDPKEPSNDDDEKPADPPLPGQGTNGRP